jgi:hypothetical protein
MLFDFKCPNGHVFERNVPSDVRFQDCPGCSESAGRLISAPTLKIPFNKDYPGASYKWARKHEKGSKKYD